jgi:hypothetical protein
MRIIGKDIIQEVYDDAINCGIVSTQQEFSRLAGRNEHWYSWVKCHDYAPSTESLLTLASRLELISKQNKSKLIQKQINQGVQKIYKVLASRVELKEC